MPTRLTETTAKIEKELAAHPPRKFTVDVPDLDAQLAQSLFDYFNSKPEKYDVRGNIKIGGVELTVGRDYCLHITRLQ